MISFSWTTTAGPSAPVTTSGTLTGARDASGDVSILWDASAGVGDLDVFGGDLARDAGLQTAVLLSLFTDRRADAGDVLPAGEDRRGWWADVDGDRWGSRLWLLDREKRTPAVLARAEEYAREALAWLVEDRVAESVTVAAEFVGGVLGLSVTISRPGRQDIATFRWGDVWTAQEARI